MFYLQFIFVVLSVTRRRPLLGQFLVGTLNHENCNVYSPNAFETLIDENVTQCFLCCVQNIFSFGFIEVPFGAKQCVRMCKDYIVCREITIILKIDVESVTLEL